MHITRQQQKDESLYYFPLLLLEQPTTNDVVYTFPLSSVYVLFLHSSKSQGIKITFSQNEKVKFGEREREIVSGKKVME